MRSMKIKVYHMLTWCLNVISDTLPLFMQLERAERGNTNAARPSNISNINMLQMLIEFPKLKIRQHTIFNALICPQIYWFELPRCLD